MDNLKVHPGLLLPSVNPLPTVLPQESPATPGHCQPTGEAAANAELALLLPKATSHANSWGRDPHAIGPWQAQDGWSMSGSTQPGRRRREPEWG